VGEYNVPLELPVISISERAFPAVDTLHRTERIASIRPENGAVMVAASVRVELL